MAGEARRSKPVRMKLWWPKMTSWSGVRCSMKHLTEEFHSWRVAPQERLKGRLKNWFPSQNTKLDQIGRWQRWTTYWDFQLSFGIRLDSIQHGSTWEAPRFYSSKTLCCTSVVNVWDLDLLRSVRSNTLFSSHLTIKEVKLKKAFHMHDRRPLQN